MSPAERIEEIRARLRAQADTAFLLGQIDARNETIAQAHLDASRLRALVVETQRAPILIAAMLRDCPEPIVYAMMEARVAKGSGVLMSDEIRAMLLVVAEAVALGDYAVSGHGDAL